MKRIIVAEDDPACADMLKRLHKEAPRLLCGEAELVVLQSRSMLERILSVSDVSLVVLDLTLPDSGQVETMEWVGKNREHLPPVYAITGDERMEVRHQCIAMGFVGFALKQHVFQSPNFFFASVYNEYLKRLEHHA